ncbi:DUF2987 domain-containing protein [Shewanella waksmanii]|uniref:DUF2987 domain-containing protein n=1 Tax=Shewanella waksmanii TaxID=213783 RepID=UPI003736C1B0
MRKGLLFSCLLLTCGVAQAAPISLEYQGFYQRLKQVNKGHYPLVEIAFSVPKTKECVVLGGSITTEKEQFPLTINESQRLFIPFDDALKSNRAVINLDMQGDGAHCGIAMQIRAKQTKQQYVREEVQSINEQMNQLLKSMQGFPMRYFSESTNGINFEFDKDQQVTITTDGIEHRFSGVYRLSTQAISELESISFSVTPKVISPWTGTE